MKKHIGMVLLSLIFSTTLFSSASGIFSEKVFDENEYEEVLYVCESYSELAIEDGTAYQGKEEFTGGYKRYVMDQGVFEYLIASGLPFEALVWKKLDGCDRAYEWVVNFRDHGYFEIAHNEAQGWFFNGFASYDEDEIEKPEGTEWSVGLPDFNVINERKAEVEKAGEKLTGEEIIFILGYCKTTVYSFRTDENTYLIPFGWRPDFTGLMTGKCYKAEEAVEILKENCQVIYADEASDNGDDIGEAVAGGSMAISEYTRKELSDPSKFLHNQKKEGLIPWIIGICGAALLGTLAIFVLRKKKRG